MNSVHFLRLPLSLPYAATYSNSPSPPPFVARCCSFYSKFTLPRHLNRQKLLITHPLFKIELAEFSWELAPMLPIIENGFQLRGPRKRRKRAPPYYKVATGSATNGALTRKLVLRRQVINYFSMVLTEANGS